VSEPDDRVAITVQGYGVLIYWHVETNAVCKYLSSLETRYEVQEGLNVAEFFTAHCNAHPADISLKQALAWRDSLVEKKQ
jgi:hypothetical protein